MSVRYGERKSKLWRVFKEIKGRWVWCLWIAWASFAYRADIYTHEQRDSLTWQKNHQEWSNHTVFFNDHCESKEESN